MSTPTRKPYLSDEIVLGRPACDILGGKEIIYFPDAMRGTRVRELYEAHLAEKDALIQLLVDSMVSANGPRVISGLSIAKFAGFTPTTEP